MRLSDEQLERLRETCAASRIKHLEWFGESPPSTLFLYEGPPAPHYPANEEVTAWVAHQNGYGYKDAALIAAAVNALPALLSEVTTARRVVEAAREYHGRF
jgi:hypothetical protein